jgi:hypothetical protein
MDHDWVNLQRLTARLESRIDGEPIQDHHEWLRLQAVRSEVAAPCSRNLELSNRPTSTLWSFYSVFRTPEQGLGKLYGLLYPFDLSRSRTRTGLDALQSRLSVIQTSIDSQKEVGSLTVLLSS